MKRLHFLLLSFMLFGLTASAQQAAQGNPLETKTFYFDNPDGTIEAYPQYISETYRPTALSISSSKYNAYDNGEEPTGQYKEIIDMLFARKARATVFVLDKREPQAIVKLGTEYAGFQAGLIAALWNEMQEKVKGQNLMIFGTYKDGYSYKAEETTFMGKEAARIMMAIDMSKSPMMVAFGAPLRFNYEQYYYYDETCDKSVGVIFQYIDMVPGEEIGDVEKLYSDVINVLGEFLGNGAPARNRAQNYEKFRRVDMIDFFKQHFHLKSKEQTFIDYGQCPEGLKLVVRDGKKTFTLCGKIISDPPYDEDVLKGGELIPPVDGGGGEGGGGGGDDPQPRPITPPINPEPPVDPDPIGGNYRPAERSGYKYGVMVLPVNGEKPFCEDERNVYILEASWNGHNAVFAVNKSTGNITEVVASMKKQPRGIIHQIGTDGKHLYLAVAGTGIVRYNGKSVASSPCVVKDAAIGDGGKEAKIIFSPNGRYMAHVGQVCKVYDSQNDYKLIKECDEVRFVDALLTDEGDIFKTNGWQTSVARNNGDIYECSSEERDFTDVLKGVTCCIQLVDNQVYLLAGIRIVKTETPEMRWSTQSKLEDTSLQYVTAYISPKGEAFASVTGAAGMDKSRFVQIDADGSTHVINAIRTGILNPYKQEYTTNHADRIYIDSLGNIWLLSNGSQIIIYNPDNIMGLSTIVNHVKTFKR